MGIKWIWLLSFFISMFCGMVAGENHWRTAMFSNIFQADHLRCFCQRHKTMNHFSNGTTFNSSNFLNLSYRVKLLREWAGERWKRMPYLFNELFFNSYLFLNVAISTKIYSCCFNPFMRKWLIELYIYFHRSAQIQTNWLTRTKILIVIKPRNVPM